MKFGSDYFEKYANITTKSYNEGWYDLGGSIVRDAIFAFHLMNLKAPKSLLDLGCANGKTLQLSKLMGVSKVRGVELSDIADEASPSIRKFITKESADLFVKGHSISYNIVCDFVAQYLEDDYLDYLDDCIQLLKPNGIFSIIYDPKEKGGKPHLHQKQYHTTSFWDKKLRKLGLTPVKLPHLYWNEHLYIKRG